jgi:hypothetical protein
MISCRKCKKLYCVIKYRKFVLSLLTMPVWGLFVNFFVIFLIILLKLLYLHNHIYLSKKHCQYE